MRRMFSLAQIQGIVALMASKGELDFSNVDIKAKTISQSQPNWELDIKSILNTATIKDSSNLYAKMCLYGNELSIVISGKFVAKENSNNYLSLIPSNTLIDIPDYIAEKIYRAEGTTLKEALSVASGFNAIITEFAYVKQNPTIASGTAILTSGGVKIIGLTVYSFGTTNEDDECYIDCRVQLLIV